MADQAVQGAMAEQGAQVAMADQGTQEAMVGQAVPGTMAELGRPWWSRQYREPSGDSGRHGGSASEAAAPAPAPAPASTAGTLTPPQKRSLLKITGSEALRGLDMGTATLSGLNSGTSFKFKFSVFGHIHD